METRNHLKIGGLKPSKRLGQHFLVDRRVLKKIIQAAELKKTDTVLEIGPGLGVLTEELAKVAKRVVGIEKDAKMVEILKEKFKNHKNLEIIHGDILKTKNYKLKTTNYKVVANIPYYITQPIIRKFLEAENPPELMVLMVQKEVAQRICAKPPEMSLLAVSVQFYAAPEIISYVSKYSFWPEPKIDSAIIRISNIYHSPSLSPKRKEEIPFGKNQISKMGSQKLFFQIVRAGFSQPRKQLINNLGQLFRDREKKRLREKVKNWLLKNNIQPEQRAETLSIKNWLGLTKTARKDFIALL